MKIVFYKLLFYLFLKLQIAQCVPYIRDNDIIYNKLNINNKKSGFKIDEITTSPSTSPTISPTSPTEIPTIVPTESPSVTPTTTTPTFTPIYTPGAPTLSPTQTPSAIPSHIPTLQPSNEPTLPWASSIVFEILIVIPGITPTGFDTDLTFAIQLAAAESMNILQNQCSVTHVR
jgi:hypothetical protein